MLGFLDLLGLAVSAGLRQLPFQALELLSQLDATGLVRVQQVQIVFLCFQLQASDEVLRSGKLLLPALELPERVSIVGLTDVHESVPGRDVPLRSDHLGGGLLREPLT